MLPTLVSQRLTLRPYRIEDALNVQRMAGEKIIADMTANIPHPYEDGMAESWIKLHQAWFAENSAAVFAIEVTGSSLHIGSMSITEIENGTGNVGYWIGTEHWGNGYATEAAKRIIDYGFNQLGLNTLIARHLVENSASENVIRKSGFVYVDDRDLKGRVVKHYELLKRN